MKKTIKTLALLFVSSLVMMSCGGPEDDAKDYCSTSCEMAELAKKAMAGEDVADDLKALEADLKELTDKYTTGDASDEDKKTFAAEIAKCDCSDAE